MDHYPASEKLQWIYSASACFVHFSRQLNELAMRAQAGEINPKYAKREIAVLNWTMDNMHQTAVYFGRQIGLCKEKRCSYMADLRPVYDWAVDVNNRNDTPAKVQIAYCGRYLPVYSGLPVHLAAAVKEPKYNQVLRDLNACSGFHWKRNPGRKQPDYWTEGYYFIDMYLGEGFDNIAEQEAKRLGVDVASFYPDPAAADYRSIGLLTVAPQTRHRDAGTGAVTKGA